MFKFTEEDLLPYATAEDVYQYCNHYDLFRHYIGNFTIGRPILSPLLSESKPSFSIFVKDGKILFNDFRLGGGDIIKFVQKRFGMSFREAVNKIIHDSGLNKQFRSDNNYVVKPIVAYKKKIEYLKPDINVKRRAWYKHDTEFWNTFGIGENTLSKYRVAPIKYIFFGTRIVVADKYAYVFTEKKDNKDTFTIYQPYSKENKWFKSHDASVFYGWSQLPAEGDKLIITKSMKDVMAIDVITGYPTVALQSEKTKPKEQIIKQLKERFKKIYLLYDNDYDNINKDKPNYGREFGNELANTFNLSQIEISDHYAIKYSAKDISDLARSAGVTLVKKVIDETINNINFTPICSHHKVEDKERESNI